jgi:hypothetical protein
MDAAEPAVLLHLRGRRTAARWLYRTEDPTFDEHVMHDCLPDGRWWVDATRGQDVARMFRDDASARAYAEG